MIWQATLGKLSTATLCRLVGLGQPDTRTFVLSGVNEFDASILQGGADPLQRRDST